MSNNAVVQNLLASSGKYDNEKEYWFKKLKGDLVTSAFHADFTRSESETGTYSCEYSCLSGETFEKLTMMVNGSVYGLFLILVSGVIYLINRYSGNEDIIIGMPPIKPKDGQEHLSNYLALRIGMNGIDNFKTIMQELKQAVSEANKNCHYPFDLIAEQLGLKRNNNSIPVFDAMVIMDNIHNREGIESVKPNMVFSFRLVNETCIEIRIEYKGCFYKKGTVEKILSHYITYLNGITAEPDKKLLEIEILSKKEKHEILIGFNNTAAQYPGYKTLHGIFEEQVKKTPVNIAAVFEGRMLTYLELNKEVNRLARTLRKRGVGPDRIVGIMLNRSLEMIMGIMAILKAGGAYLPINPEYPVSRIRYMLEDSSVSILLTSESFQSNVEFNGKIMNIEDPSVFDEDDTELNPVNSPQDLAYIIYTSGSTGNPKGAMIEHFSVINRIHWMQSRYPLDANDVILQKTPFTFDVSVWELFWWSFAGAKVCFLKPGGEKDPECITRAIYENSVTTIHFVPSMLNVFLDYHENTNDLRKLESLKRVFASGEALTPQQVARYDRLFRQNSTTLHNLYGPTEATVDVSYYDCIPGMDSKIVPIGKPINNIQLLILNKQMQLQPVGIAGELVISGDGVGRGYINKPELTLQKFLNNPYFPEKRMYKTGDLARWIPDGNIEYLGRMDSQVKIRGFRIELGEIENQLLKCEGIKDTAVIVKTDKDGDKQLVAFYTSDRRLNVEDIRETLLESLVDYMVPAYFIKLEQMPLSQNGKTDRKALQEIQPFNNDEEECIPARNPVEAKLIEIWNEILECEKIGINSNFFKIGGHSLKATIMATKIHKAFNISLSLSQIFEKPTIKELAELIGTQGSYLYASIEPAKEAVCYPLSSAQRRLYILNRLENSNTAYNCPGVLMLEGTIDPGHIEDVFKRIIERHDAFRTSFSIVNDEPVQTVCSQAEFNIQRIEANENSVLNEIKAFIRPFNLQQAPLLRVALIKIAQNKHILLFDTHHIITDGTSMDILVREFIELYENKTPKEIKARYKDFAVWQKQGGQSDTIKKQEEFWLNTFKDTVPIMELPIDFQRPAMQSYHGKSIFFDLNKDLTEALKKICSNKVVTLYMVLLAAYNILLAKYSGQEDLVVGSPIAGRTHPDVENIIGVFINMLAMRNKPEADKSFSDFLDEVAKNSILAYENQDYQYEELVNKLDIPKNMGRNPLFDTVFIFQNTQNIELKLEGIEISPYTFDYGSSKYDLTLEGAVKNGRISFRLEYSTDLFRSDTAERLTKHFTRLIEDIVNNPKKCISDLEINSEEEKEQILYKFNDTEIQYDEAKTINQLFEEQAARTPNEIAVIYKGRQFTYSELNERASRLAGVLRAKGIKPGSMVGIMVRRSCEMLICIMAVLKAGGAYLPIDPEYPSDRINFMLKDGDVRILLSQDDLAEKINFRGEILDIIKADTYAMPRLDFFSGNNSRDAAYVIYTSGSTGMPKGVVIPHRAVNNFIHGIVEKIDFEHYRRILNLTTISFDIFVLETLLPLTRGMTVVVADESEQLDTKQLNNLIHSQSVDVIQMTPSRIQMLIRNSKDLKFLETLKIIMIGGETFPKKLLEDLQQRSSARIYNMYGPTETTVWSTVADLTNTRNVHIGSPIANTQVYITDKRRKLQPVGIAGELCIAGDGLAIGYLNRPELTEEKFVNNPYENEKKIYKTGDLAKWLPDGNIECLGRMDNQVKLRGYRIEVEEIEKVLVKYDGVKDCVVSVRTGDDGEKYLAGYYIAKDEISKLELRRHLLNVLPEYMVPDVFMRLEHFPSTLNGKVDRKLLPTPEMKRSEFIPEYKAAEKSIQKELVDIWSEVLRVELVGIEDNFFELGGNSMSLVRMHTKIDALYPNQVNVADIFANPTISRLAEFIGKKNKCKESSEVLMPVSFPEEFLIYGSKESVFITLKRNVDNEKVKIIQSIIQGEYNIDQFVMSVYVFLISEIAETSRLTVYFTAAEDRKVIPLTFDLSKATDLGDILNMVSCLKDRNLSTGTVSIEQIIHSKKYLNDNRILLLYSNDIGDSSDFDEAFDIVMQSGSTGEVFDITIGYNAARVKEEKLEEMFDQYMNMIETIIGGKG